MKAFYGPPLSFERAPAWAERTAPRNMLKRQAPALLLICMPDEDDCVLATLEETDAIADPNSFMGRLLRGHCALMSLPYTSNN